MMRKHAGSRRRGLWLALAAFLVLTGAGLVVWQSAVRADRQMRTDLLQQTQLAAQSLSLDDIRAMSFTVDDAGTPPFRRVQRQLEEARRVMNAKWIYTMVVRDGRIIFGPDNTEEGTVEYEPPGDAYNDAPEELWQVVADHDSATAGPYTDEWGTFVSAFVPVFDPETNELVMILGSDVDASDWRWNVAAQAALPSGLALLLILGLVTALLIARRPRSVSREAPEDLGTSLAALALATASRPADSLAGVRLSRGRIVAVAAAALAITVGFSVAMVYRADGQLRDELLQQTRLVAQALDMSHVSALTFTEKDLTTLPYQRLRQELIDSDSVVSARSRYLVLSRDDGFVFGPDNLPEGDSDHASPGTPYLDPPQELCDLVSSGKAVTVGPYRDEWGAYVSAFVPIEDPRTGRILAVLGANVETDQWYWNVLAKASTPIGLMAVLMLVLVTLLVARRRPKEAPKLVMRRLMLPLAAGLVSLVVAFTAVFWWQQEDRLSDALDDEAGDVSMAFRNLLTRQSAALAGILQPLATDPRVVDALAAKDSERLLAEYRPTLERLGQQFNINRLSFLDAQCQYVAKVHAPNERGSQATLYTIGEAARTGQLTTGLDLEPSGTLVLVAVQPVYRESTLVGYVGVSKDLDSVLHYVRNESGVDLALTIHKSCLDRQEWEAAAKAMGRPADWDRYAENVVAYSSIGVLPEEFAGLMAENEKHLDDTALDRRELRSDTWRATQLPLVTASGQHVGDLIVMLNVAREAAAFGHIAATGGMAIVVVLATLLAFLMVTLKRTDLAILQREVRLQQSEARHRILFDRSADALLLMAPPDWRFFSVNSATVQLFGAQTAEELTAAGPAALSPERQPDGRLSSEKAAAMIDVAMRYGSNLFEWTHRRLSGEEFPASVRLTRMEMDGRVILHAMVRDITAQKQAENEVRRAREFLQTVMDAIPERIRVVDLDYRIVLANRGARSAWRDRGDIIGQTCFFVSYGADRPCLIEGQCCPVAEVKRTSRPASAVMARTNDRGEPIYIEISAAPIFDDTGRVVQIIEVCRDITQRVRAEEAAKAENAKLSAMISGMDEGVVFANADNVIVEINEYLCRFVGRTREEIIGRRLEELHHGPALDKILAQIDRFRTTPDAPPLVLQRPLGGAEVILRMQPIYRDGTYDGVLLNVVDVTELVRARKQAEDASRAKSFFLANMSHEIRTPMTAIMGYTELLADDGLTPTERDGYLAVIHRNGHHLLSLINDMLDLSKIEAGKMSIVLARCHLPSIVADVASIMRVRADERAITLAVEYRGPVPTTIETDADRLRQALVNLVGNAIKFTETGGVRVVVSFLKDGLEGQPAVQMQVIDTGIGIAPETVRKLFEPFEQADVTTSRRYGGTGLGLAITRRIATLLGGTVGVETQLGKGSTFTLTVPTGPLDGVPMIEDPAEALQRCHVPRPDRTVIPRQALDRVRILLVEDGMDNQRLISTVLRKAGATVDIAENGNIAVRRAENGCYDVVLMDMQMPEMDGFEATRILREKGFSAPILALTAHAMATDRQRCLDAGCDEHLTKPIDRAAMINAIRRHVDAAVAQRVSEDLLAPEATASEPPSSPTPLAGGEDMIFSSFAQDSDLVGLVEAFIAGLPQQMRVMKNQLAAGLFDDLRRGAHQLKGAGGSYGYPTLTEAAKDLEDAAKAADAEMATAALAELSRRCEAAIRGHIHGAMFRGDVR